MSHAFCKASLSSRPTLNLLAIIPILRLAFSNYQEHSNFDGVEQKSFDKICKPFTSIGTNWYHENMTILLLSILLSPAYTLFVLTLLALVHLLCQGLTRDTCVNNLGCLIFLSFKLTNPLWPECLSMETYQPTMMHKKTPHKTQLWWHALVRRYRNYTRSQETHAEPEKK